MSKEVAVPILSLRPDKIRSLPQYMSTGAAGLDLPACLDDPVTLVPGTATLVGTGYALAVPPGYEAQIRPRSGLALRHQIGILNSPGTIDSDYRGEIRVILFNFGQQPYTIQDGDRIAQLVLCPVPRIRLVPVERLDETDRGGGGYGHTGR
ncbi:MAG: dUTP diphosphatase [candidate division Zixibacteria bacterium]|nr:dUTP diphosphatase [candidate division Zixibacteria bacterium]